MNGTKPKDVKHYCRKCARSFESGSKSAHTRLVAHVRSEHGFPAAARCHSNCSFKATFDETNEKRMLYGEGAFRKIFDEVITNNPNMR